MRALWTEWQQCEYGVEKQTQEIDGDNNNNKKRSIR